MKTSLLNLLIAVLLGFALGIFYERNNSCYFNPQDRFEKDSNHFARKMKFFSKELDLTEQQQSQIEQIFQRSRTQLSELRDKVRPEFKNLRTAARKEIRTILTPEQQLRFDEMHKKRMERRNERRRSTKLTEIRKFQERRGE